MEHSGKTWVALEEVILEFKNAKAYLLRAGIEKGLERLESIENAMRVKGRNVAGNPDRARAYIECADMLWNLRNSASAARKETP